MHGRDGGQLDSGAREWYGARREQAGKHLLVVHSIDSGHATPGPAVRLCSVLRHAYSIAPLYHPALFPRNISRVAVLVPCLLPHSLARSRAIESVFVWRWSRQRNKWQFRCVQAPWRRSRPSLSPHPLNSHAKPHLAQPRHALPDLLYSSLLIFFSTSTSTSTSTYCFSRPPSPDTT
jgi:hypothetical protein